MRKRTALKLVGTFCFCAGMLLAFLVFKGSLPYRSTSQSAPLANSDLLSAREYLGAKVGVDPLVLEVFFKRLSETPSTSQDPIVCVSFLDNGERTEFLRCLVQSGNLIFQLPFYQKLTAYRVKHSQRNPTIENQMIVSLLSWVEDLIRERLKKEGTNTYWYDHQSKQFIAATKASDFPFKDGDIVIAVGTSAISALISAVMDPHRGYSHAMLIRKPPGQEPFIIDATIEYGVSVRDITVLDESSYQQALVLRPFVDGSASFSETIAARASEIAFESAQAGVPYDEAMDPDEHSKLFCSELVNYAYAQAATKILSRPLTAKEVGPSRAKVRSDQAFQFLNLLGVTQNVISSPGDLGTSPHLQVVADYRNMDNPIDYWTALLAGEAFLEGLESNRQVRVDPYEIWPLVSLACVFNRPAWLLGYILDSDWQLIPSAISCSAAKVIKTHSDKIHDRVLEVVSERVNAVDPHAAINNVSPWYVYAAIRKELYDSTGAGWYFRAS